MIVEIKIPTPGESITEVELGKWLVEDGAIVEKDQEIAEIESDKATLALIASETGQVKILVQEGEKVAVGAVACTIDTDAKEEGTASSTFKVQSSKLTDSMKSEVVSRETEASSLEKSEVGSREREASSLEKSEVRSRETEASSLEEAEKDRRRKTEDGSKQSGGGRSQQPENSQEPIAKSQPPATSENIKVTAVAQQMMDEHHLSVDDVIAGLRRLSKKDVELVINNNTDSTVTQSTVSFSRNENRERMSSLRRKLSERLVSVKNETAMLTTFNEVDMSKLMELREKYQQKFTEKYGYKLGYMAFFTKAVAEAIKFHPSINAQIDGEEIVSPEFVDVGIAVQTPKGLMVPIVRNAESKTVAAIEGEIKELAEKARNKQISVGELSGGTFTITNGGTFGSLLSTPIINPPQSAILGMHNIVERPIAVDGQVVIRPMMYVALSYDHRVIDGKDSVGFLVKVKEFIENPALLLTGGQNPEELLLGL